MNSSACGNIRALSDRTFRASLILLAVLAVFNGTNVEARIKPTEPRIESVTFEGNHHFSDKQLRKLMISRPTSLLFPSYYYPDILKDDLSQIVLFYKSRGYLSARITKHQVDILPDHSHVAITILVAEGPVTRVEGVSVFGNEVIPERHILNLVKLKPGDPLLRSKIDKAAYDILHLYADLGYLEAHVTPDVRVDADQHLALIDYLIEEGIRYRVGTIQINGLETTQKQVVARELNFKLGQIIRYSNLLKSQRKLYLTGLFESVFIKPAPVSSLDDSMRTILVDIREGLDKEFNFRFGFNTVEKLRGGVELINGNLAGMGRRASIRTQLSFIGRSLELSYTEPWTFDTPWRTDLNLIGDLRREPGYDAYRIGGSITVGRQIQNIVNLSFTYRHENVDLRNIRVLEAGTDMSSRIRLLQTTLTLDTRDNVFNPTRGVYSEWSNEVAGLYLSGTSQFTRSVLSFSTYKSIIRQTILAGGFEFGWMDASAGLSSIPLNERLYGGGPNSLRGFRYQRLGPRDPAGTPTGGRVKLIVHALEIRQTVYKVIGAAVFLDIGNVWSIPAQVRFSTFRYSPGLGLRADTPIGLARLEYGFNPEPRSNEPSGRIYFSIGQAF